MLVPDHLLLLLKVSHYLSQTFLKYLNLVLVIVDCSGLVLGSNLVLFFSALVDGYVSFDPAVELLLLLDLSLLLFKLIPLGDGLEGQGLVVFVDFGLDVLDVYSMR